MRRVLRIAIAIALTALVAVGIRRLLEPAEHDAIPDAIPSSTGDGWPAPASAGLASPTREELYSEAQRLDIQGRSKMNKQELQEAVEAATTGGSV
jgi:hypothetical protein